MIRSITDLWIADDISMITVGNMPNGITSVARVFDALGSAGINIDMISYLPDQKDTTVVSFTVSDRDFAKTLEILGRFQKVLGDHATQVNAGNVKLTLHGEAMRDAPGVAAAVFGHLAQSMIEAKLITTSETEIAFLVDAKDADKAATVLRDGFGV